MKHTLVLRLCQAQLSETSELEWALFDDHDQLRSTARGNLLDLGQQLADKTIADTLVIVPGELVLLTSTEIPSRQTRQIRQALPYMVEELIADDIETVHLAIPNLREREDFRVPVAVVRHELLVQWLDELAQHGMRPDFITADTLCVPLRDNQWQLLLDGERLLLRRGPHAAQVTVETQLPHLVQALKTQEAEPLQAVVASCDEDPRLEPIAEALREVLTAEVETRRYQESLLEVLAATALRQRNELINLLQGGYKVQNTREGGAHRRRRIGVAAAAALLVYVLAAVGTGVYFQNRADALERQQAALYRELFPDARRVVSPRRQLENRLQQTGGTATGASFVTLLAQAAQPLAGQQQLAIDTLRYDDDGSLRLEVRAPSIQALDELKQRLDQQGLAVEINSAAEQEDHFLGRLVIRGS